MIEPISITFEVRCPAAHAFAVWTEQTSRWWPKSHMVSGDPAATVIIDGRVGGRIVERTSTGTEVAYGEVTTWDPPHRLGYRWHIRRTPADATDVLITFTDMGDTTHVDILHSGWDRLPDGASWRDANRGGWSGLLPHFVAAI